jgi:oxygen-independent coproporphyrinogen-3 oxidase
MLLYLHIPFCDAKCPYCGFHSYTQHQEFQARYMKAVLHQLRHEIKRFSLENRTITSVFIGGGTPSTLPAYMYNPFFEAISPYLAPHVEISCEANPNSATQAWLQGMRELGVTRISMGVQSFHAQKLHFLGRTHTSHQATHSLLQAAEAGFEQLSLDLIYGTALDTKPSLEADLEIAFSLPITHLSAYSLTLEEGTPFAHKKEYTNTSSSLARWFTDAIVARGFEHYEISNFGVQRCLHNLGYWQHQRYIGLGCGAVGFDGHSRLYPTKEIHSYLNDPTRASKETLTSKEIVTEKIFLGLRSCVGVEMALLNPTQQASAKTLIEAGTLLLLDQRLFNTDYFLSDEIALFLLD